MEIWKDIKGYEGLYQVSNQGRVKSLERRCKTKTYTRRVPEKIRSQSLDNYGYPIVSLSKDHKHKTLAVHRLVAEAFIPNPNNFATVNHKDEDKTNNDVSNLEWCTVQYNNEYGTRVERGIKAQQRPILQCDLEGNVIKEWPGIGATERANGYSSGLISRVCNGKRLTAYGFKWKFK